MNSILMVDTHLVIPRHFPDLRALLQLPSNEIPIFSVVNFHYSGSTFRHP